MVICQTETIYIGFTSLWKFNSMFTVKMGETIASWVHAAYLLKRICVPLCFKCMWKMMNLYRTHIICRARTNKHRKFLIRQKHLYFIYLNNTQIKIVLNKRFINSRVLNILTASTIALRNLWLVSVGPASTYWEERHFIASSSSSIAMSEMAYVLFMPSLY